MSDVDPQKPVGIKSPVIRPLDYQSAESRRTPGVVQLMVGAGGWFVVLGMTIACGQISLNAAGIGFLISLILLCIFGVIYRRRRGWTLFGAGVLIGFGLSILIGVGLCFRAIQHI